jgi:hypothetical protein
VPFLNAFPAACRNGVLSVKDRVSLFRCLPAIKTWHRRRKLRSDHALGGLLQENAALPNCVIDCLLVKCKMPEVVPDQLGLQHPESEVHIVDTPTMDTFPVHERLTA